jgi:hypothetical protein
MGGSTCHGRVGGVSCASLWCPARSIFRLQPSSAFNSSAVNVPCGDIDPVYSDSPYYLYPDGPIAVETLRVIGAAMAEAGVVGLGRLTLRRRERMVMVEPRGTGMALITLRAADEVRASQFGTAEGELDAEMVAIARLSRGGPALSIRRPTEIATRKPCAN